MNALAFSLLQHCCMLKVYIHQYLTYRKSFMYTWSAKRGCWIDLVCHTAQLFIAAGNNITWRHYMCHTGHHGHVYMYHHVCPGLVTCLRAWICPSKHHPEVHVYMCTTPPYLSPCIVGIVVCLRAWCCPLQAKTTHFLGCVHAYLHVVHPGIT